MKKRAVMVPLTFARLFIETLGVWGQVPQKVLAIGAACYFSSVFTRNKGFAVRFSLAALTVAQFAAGVSNLYQLTS